MAFRSFFQAPDRLRTDLSHEDIVDVIHANDSRIWVDVTLNSDRTEWITLGQELGLHPLTLEDTLNPESRI